MEQTNLVVTPDGKTWDEVTRDVSYIGNIMYIEHSNAQSDGVPPESGTGMFHRWMCLGKRGLSTGITAYQKDFAIAYDRIICLKDGQYGIQTAARQSSTGTAQLASEVQVNGVRIAFQQEDGTLSRSGVSSQMRCDFYLKRGDYIQGSMNGVIANPLQRQTSSEAYVKIIRL
jgi:hypothetical protein